MKKFSGITNETLGESKENEENELETLKSNIFFLIDGLLTVELCGPIRQYSPQAKISGKDVFVNALLELISSKSGKDQIEILESLKSESKDWASIDYKIDKISNQIESSKILSESLNERKKIEKIIKIYGKSDDFEEIVEKTSLKIKDNKTSQSIGITALRMSNNPLYNKYVEKLKLISEKFLLRSIK